jgi:hypothetical protein
VVGFDPNLPDSLAAIEQVIEDAQAPLDRRQRRAMRVVGDTGFEPVASAV